MAEFRDTAPLNWASKHARGNLSARDAVEDEESPNSCEDDTSSVSSDYDDFSVCRRVIWSDVCTRGRNPKSKLGMGESIGGDFLQGGGRGVALILTLCEGGWN